MYFKEDTFRISNRVICDWLDTLLTSPVFLRWCDIPVSASTVIGYAPETRRFKIARGNGCGWKKRATLKRTQPTHSFRHTFYQGGWKSWTIAQRMSVLDVRAWKLIYIGYTSSEISSHWPAMLINYNIVTCPRFSVVEKKAYVCLFYFRLVLLLEYILEY